MSNYNCSLCPKQYIYLAHFKNHITSKHDIVFGDDDDINDAIINSLNKPILANNKHDDDNLINTGPISTKDCVICMNKSKTTAFFRCGAAVRVSQPRAQPVTGSEAAQAANRSATDTCIEIGH